MTELILVAKQEIQMRQTRFQHRHPPAGGIPRQIHAGAASLLLRPPEQPRGRLSIECGQHKASTQVEDPRRAEQIVRDVLGNQSSVCPNHVHERTLPAAADGHHARRGRHPRFPHDVRPDTVVGENLHEKVAEQIGAHPRHHSRIDAELCQHNSGGVRQAARP